ncbi:calmodulin-like protein 6 [Saimiri boliviensis]|uniref:calmodulin-like protein 6 n=1 Tax=Saimiri boliviensis TaxID=27679 RepID=UPI000533E74C|nr:calmodulin-like protein 6 isoform X1 [Saimiri boliviensis boliviensis]
MVGGWSALSHWAPSGQVGLQQEISLARDDSPGAGSREDLPEGPTSGEVTQRLVRRRGNSEGNSVCEAPTAQPFPAFQGQAERLSAEQIKEYKGVFEMFDEEGNGQVKTGELERLMSLLGINPTKSELASMAKDVDKDNKGFFNCDGFLALMGVYHEKAQNQESELRAAFRVFDKEGKGYIDWNTLKYVLMNAGEPLNEVEAEQMMKEADKDGDGTIDYEEFVAMMTGESFKLVQ